jgi:hypothetical protein
MDYLTLFYVGWDEFVDMFIEFLCWFMIFSCDASFGSSYVGPLRVSHHFVPISHLLFSSSSYLMAFF